MIPRTLRAANCGLYIGCILFIIFAVVYVALTKELAPWAFYVVIASGIVGTLWGVSYIMAFFRIDAKGITRCGITGSTRMLWAELTDVSYTETDERGIASCCLELSFGVRKMLLSTELLNIDDIKDLVADLKACGLMKNDDDTSK